MMLSRESWPQPQSLSKVSRNEVRATPDAAWKAIGVWKQKCSDTKNDHFTIHKEKLQVIELSHFNQHRHQTSRLLKRFSPKVKFQDSLKDTSSSLPSSPSSPPSLPSPSPSLYINYLYFCVSSLLRVSYVKFNTYKKKVLMRCGLQHHVLQLPPPSLRKEQASPWSFLGHLNSNPLTTLLDFKSHCCSPLPSTLTTLTKELLSLLLVCWDSHPPAHPLPILTKIL